MNEKDDKWEAELQAYKKGLGISGKQKDAPIKKTLLYRKIDAIHQEVFDHAYAAYEHFLSETGDSHIIERSLRQQVKENLMRGETEEAFKARDQLLQYTK